MKEILFGWITKPKMMQTYIDDIVMCIELCLLVILIFAVIAIIMSITEDKKCINYMDKTRKKDGKK